MRTNLRIQRRFGGGTHGHRTCTKRAHMRTDNTSMVWRQDSLGRSLKDPIARPGTQRSGWVGLKGRKEAIKRDSPARKLIFRSLAARAKFEHAPTRERTQACLKRARGQRGKGGRGERLDGEQSAHTVQVYRPRQHTGKKCVEAS